MVCAAGSESWILNVTSTPFLWSGNDNDLPRWPWRVEWDNPCILRAWHWLGSEFMLCCHLHFHHHREHHLCYQLHLLHLSLPVLSSFSFLLPRTASLCQHSFSQFHCLYHYFSHLGSLRQWLVLSSSAKTCTNLACFFLAHFLGCPLSLPNFLLPITSFWTYPCCLDSLPADWHWPFQSGNCLLFAQMLGYPIPPHHALVLKAIVLQVSLCLGVT